MYRKAIFITIFILIFFSGCSMNAELKDIIEPTNYNVTASIDPISTPTNVQEDNQNVTETLIQWNETANISDIIITININTNIALPSKSIPIIEVTPKTFELNFAQELVEYFLGNEYYNANIRTKNDWLLQINEIQRIINKYNNSNNDIGNLQNMLNLLQEQYNQSQDINELGDITFSDVGENQLIYLKSYPNENCYATIRIQNDEMQRSTLLYNIKDYTRHYEISDLGYSNIAARGMNTSYDNALITASNAVENIAPEMELYSTGLANICSTYEISLEGYENFNQNTECEQCYVFYFTRKYCDIKTLFLQKILRDSTLFDYRNAIDEIFTQESIRVIVDDTGIVDFRWVYPCDVVQVLDENTDIISIDEVLEIFKKNIYNSSLFSSSQASKIDVNISKIEFGMMRLSTENENGNYQVVPVWSFTGSKQEYFDDDIIDNDNSNMIGSNKCLFLINAIDGSVIDTILEH